jgi:translation elongation factor EF-4
MNRIDRFAWTILGLLYVLAIVVLPRLTEDAMGMLVGFTFGVLGVLPMNIFSDRVLRKMRSMEHQDTPRTITVINPHTGERLILEVESYNLLRDGAGPNAR